MNRTQLPQPPDPSGYQSVASWQAETYRWMCKVKSQIEIDSAVNTSPMAPFVLGTFTAVTTLVGTDATSNALATLMQKMLDKGLLSSVSPRTTT